jgi:hypothetical protein
MALAVLLTKTMKPLQSLPRETAIQTNFLEISQEAERSRGEETEAKSWVALEASHRRIAGRVQAHRHAVDVWHGRQQVRRASMA